jgi:hypothetical protein
VLSTTAREPVRVATPAPHLLSLALAPAQAQTPTSPGIGEVVSVARSFDSPTDAAAAYTYESQIPGERLLSGLQPTVDKDEEDFSQAVSASQEDYYDPGDIGGGEEGPSAGGEAGPSAGGGTVSTDGVPYRPPTGGSRKNHSKRKQKTRRTKQSNTTKHSIRHKQKRRRRTYKQKSVNDDLYDNLLIKNK